MNNKFKSIVALTCCATILCGVFTGCSDENIPGKTTTELNGYNVDNSINHVDNTVETQKYVIKNGDTDYKIVIPDNASATVKEAAKELSQFAAEATGALLSTVKDNELTDNEKYISLGKTSFAETAGVYDVANLGNDGYRIKTVGDNVYVIGKDYGTLYGVYGLLNDLVGYEFFYKNTYSLDKKSDVKLKNYDITEIPDIPNRPAGYGTMWQEAQTLNRYRTRVYNTYLIPVRGEVFHNSFAYLPYDTHSATHSKWYNGSGTQLCYTAHGDETEYNAMIDEVVSVLKEELKRYPDRDIVSLSCLDNIGSCSCDACVQCERTYGSASAAIILMLNKVNAQIKEWFAGDGAEYARDLKICFFAYFAYVKPPVEYNAQTGEYVPVNGIRCDDGVGVIYAPIEADYTESFDAIENEAIRSAILGWSAVSDIMMTWFYDTLYLSTNNHYVFYNTFNGFQNRLRYAYSVNSQWMFLQGQDMVFGGMTGFTSLKMYLYSKLSWNVNDDYQALIERFFDNFYGEASDKMMQIFDEMRVRSAYFKEEHDAAGDCYAALDNPTYWPKSQLCRWHDLANEALEALLKVKDVDAERYELLKSHVSFERLGINFLLCSLWKGSLSDEDYEKYRLEFVEDAAISGNTDAAKSSLLVG